MFAFILALVSAPFAFLAGNRGGMAGVGMSFIIFIAYVSVDQLFEQLGNLNELPPQLAAWSRTWSSHLWDYIFWPACGARRRALGRFGTSWVHHLPPDARGPLPARNTSRVSATAVRSTFTGSAPRTSPRIRPSATLCGCWRASTTPCTENTKTRCAWRPTRATAATRTSSFAPRATLKNWSGRATR